MLIRLYALACAQLVACSVRLFGSNGSAAALKILEEVRSVGLEVGEIMYNTVMEACGAAGQTKMSLSLLDVRGGVDGVGLGGVGGVGAGCVGDVWWWY